VSIINSYDYTIIGGGIVGLSVAWQLQLRKPKSKILLIEKEAQLAQHQSSHNSGVIHAGVYYPPDSLKADFCKRGAQATMDFCRKYHIAFQQPGKLLVASNAIENQRMTALQQRCKDSGIHVEALTQAQLIKAEPNVIGLGALLVEQSGIVDYQKISIQMAKLFIDSGGIIQTETELISVEEQQHSLTLQIRSGSCKKTIMTKFAVSCAGLMADRVTAQFKIKTDFLIVPFRGEYYQLDKNKDGIINRMIYPIPDPDLPFLGVHLTPMIDGRITVGPNAVLGWKREGYGRINFNLEDSLQMLAFPGFWKLGKNQICTAIQEYKNSIYKRGYLQKVKKYCPNISLSDLRPYPAGIRAQAIMNDGSLVHDFLFAESPRSLHTCNAPSPAATSAIPIGEYICDRIIKKSTLLN
jgi:L-2-hydroxyglutarate oxidase